MLFDSIFAKTHKELEFLNDEISKLQDVYLTNNDNSDKESDNETNEFSINKTSEPFSVSLVVYIDHFFTACQFEHFHKIYTLHPIRMIMEEEKIRDKRSDKRDDDAFLMKLNQFCCCVKRCLLNVNHQAALKRFQQMKAMLQNKSKLCFLGIIDASMNATEFKNRTQKAYLTMNYKFEGVKICQKACLTRHVSNYAISFSTVLNVLKFIINFTNQHRLPSPDFTENIQISYSSQQEGVTYFKSLYKVEVFGVCEEAMPWQINYLIPEDQSVVKGPNTVISLVHHYFATHGLVKVRKSFNDDETEISVAKVSSIPKTKNNGLILSDVIVPQGINLERQWYLHEEVAQHIQNPAKCDIYCSMPNQPKPKKLKNQQTVT
ncbi:16942_t:CDS:2 [Cetraspora pellucida]|uniref:16942_t:CDS:1 n=1 Tax=Cetraspora pellucida TaxID=1433469 RepID=A0A9N9NFX4_9GLOM|nr:16942_t:CDS:2 [Cetraspora pellucida]